MSQHKNENSESWSFIDLIVLLIIVYGLLTFIDLKLIKLVL